MSIRRLARTGVIALVGLSLSLTAVDARDYDGDVGLIGGTVKPDEDLSGVMDQSWNDTSALLGGRLGFLLTDRWGLFADGTHSWITTRNSGKTGTLDFRGGVELFGPELWENAPLYLAGAGGVERIDFDGATDTLTRPLVSAGLGQRFPLGPLFGRWEARVTHAFAKSEDATIAAPDLGEAFTHASLHFGLSIPFGGSDSDGDGVRDRNDRCAATPAGALVDRHGCGVDSDGDRVFDGLDRCADTPAGWPVDASGCPTDKDGDGVPDGADRCAKTLAGAKVDANGCATDADGDGVPDGLDHCNDTPQGAKVDSHGCAVDTDRDGVPDGLDKCPGTPAGTKVDARGCAILFEDKRSELVLEGVTFESNSARLRPESLGVLDRVAGSLAAWPEVNVEVGGHTDSQGAAAHNADLSERRAETVRKYLVDKGVKAGQLTVRGYGEAEPIADNGRADGRARNRRVTLRRR
ncbi:OmpA family protein [bacterium]|nr:OmpA family protein [bacterium]